MATTNKYDRQLRLWGSSGQKALSSSHVILLNASACGTETLKNLVLPGIGSFHVVDDALVTPRERFANFFAPATAANAGRSRASLACELLRELNEDAEGTHERVPDLGAYDLGGALGERSGKRLVVAADLPLDALARFSSVCRDAGVPFVSAKSWGMVGTVRVQVENHFVVESKPDNSVPDLRLANFDPPFLELRELAEGIDLDLLSDIDHGHTPYVVLLIKALEKWRAGNEGNRFPKTMSEKNSFRCVIKDMSRNFDDEANFREAHRNANLAYTRHALNEEVMEVLENNNASSSADGVLCRALSSFLRENEDEPPLNGSIPDMTSSTDLYVKLQKIYRQKAQRDLQLFTQHVHRIDATVPPERIQLFCKNVYNLRYLTTRTLQEELSFQTGDRASPSDQSVREDLLAECGDPADPPAQTPLLWYLALRACEMHQSHHRQHPGADSRRLALEADVASVRSYLALLLERAGLDGDPLLRSLVDERAHAEEMVRYDNAELHNVAAVVGGVASQEIVKLITEQYVPLDNTFVFNGLAGIGAVYRF